MNNKIHKIFQARYTHCQKLLFHYFGNAFVEFFESYTFQWTGNQTFPIILLKNKSLQIL